MERCCVLCSTGHVIDDALFDAETGELWEQVYDHQVAVKGKLRTED